MKNKETIVKTLVDDWQNTHCGNLAKSTQYGYKTTINAYILPILGKKAVRDIKQRDIQNIINSIASSGKSTKTQKNTIGILHSIFEYAVINKIIDVNPVKQIVTKKTAPYEYYIYTSDEYKNLLNLFKGDRDIIPVLLGGTCGMRLSEIFGLKWSDIDFKKKYINIRRTAIAVGARHTDIKNCAKTAAGNRIISVPAEVLEQINFFITGKDDWLMPDKSNNQPENNYNFYRRYRRKIEKAGLPYTRFHDLRHFAATQFLDAGVPDKYAAKYLGHTDTNMTRKYQHIRQQVIPFPLGDTAPKVIIDTLPASVRSV